MAQIKLNLKRFCLYISKTKKINIQIPDGEIFKFLEDCAKSDGVSLSRYLIRSGIIYGKFIGEKNIQKRLKKMIKKEESYAEFTRLKKESRNLLNEAYTLTNIQYRIFDLAWAGVDHHYIYRYIRHALHYRPFVNPTISPFEKDMWNYLDKDFTKTRCGAYRLYVQEMKKNSIEKPDARLIAQDYRMFFKEIQARRDKEMMIKYGKKLPLEY